MCVSRCREKVSHTHSNTRDEKLRDVHARRERRRDTFSLCSPSAHDSFVRTCPAVSQIFNSTFACFPIASALTILLRNAACIVGTCLSSNAAVLVNLNRSDVFPTRPSPSSTTLNDTDALPLVLAVAFPPPPAPPPAVAWFAWFCGCNCTGAERSIADNDANVGCDEDAAIVVGSSLPPSLPQHPFFFSPRGSSLSPSLPPCSVNYCVREERKSFT